MLKNPLADKGLLTREFFREVVKEKKLESHFQADERSRWLSNLQLEGKAQVLFELEMYLKGVAYYFNLHNQPIPDISTVAARDFLPELLIVKAAVKKVTQLSLKLHRQELDNVKQFRQFLASVATHEVYRGRFLTETLQQHTPEESLAVLIDGFNAFRSLLNALGKQSRCSLPLFRSIGELITRELVNNRFFNPFAILIYRPEYDRIESVALLEGLRSVKKLQYRREIIRVFFALWRLHRYTAYLPTLQKDDEAQSTVQGSSVSTMILFALIHAEVNILASYLQGGLCQRLGQWAEESGLKKMCHAQAEHMKNDIHRILVVGLGKADRDSLGIQLPQSAAVSAAMLSSLLEEVLLAFAQHFVPTLKAEELFDKTHCHTTMVARLRQDVWVMQRLIERISSDRESLNVTELHRFLVYFRDVAYLLLTLDERNEFDTFIDTFEQHKTAAAISDEVANAAQKLGTALSALEQRLTEQSGATFNQDAAQELYATYAR